MRVGFIGWRGMVGSVLMTRMQQEGDFDGLEADFFSTSNAGAQTPAFASGSERLLDAHHLPTLQGYDVLLSCQGGSYTEKIYPALRQEGWDGIWIDAASTLRMEKSASLILDPLNGDSIGDALHRGVRTFVGANCTVSLLLMGLAGLLKSGHVQWISSMTYQAASGAGAQNLIELIKQMRTLGDQAATLLDTPTTTALELDQHVTHTLASDSFPQSHFGAPLAASALPWIDRLVEEGQTREEWKAMAEANKILNRESNPIPIDGLCVRIGSMRCHAQALTVHLDTDLPLDEITGMIGEAHPWVEVVDNEEEATLKQLTPVAVSGSLQIPVGRLRKMKMGSRYLSAFTVGDQLLWGAAEPLRRMLEILRADPNEWKRK